MAKKQKPVDQFVCSDEKLQLALIAVADRIDNEARLEVWRTYNSEELHNAYRAFRNFNSLRNGFSKQKTMREIVRIPAGHVYQFLKTTFEPKYGDQWLRNKQVLRSELIRPWWIVERI